MDKNQLTNRKKIDNDFTQSYWLALQFVPTKKNKPSWIFTVVCHRHPTEQGSTVQNSTRKHTKCEEKVKLDKKAHQDTRQNVKLDPPARNKAHA